MFERKKLPCARVAGALIGALLVVAANASAASARTLTAPSAT